MLNLQGKLSAYDFYCSLELQTDGSGLVKVPDRMAAFFLMVREFWHVRMAKRAGRAFDPTGIVGTPLGGLAVQCRACPHPTINLPRGWDTAPSDTFWIYRLFIHKDCNFRMTNQLCSSKEKDTTLSNGLAYFVENKSYSNFVLEHASEQEVKGCAGFAVLLTAVTKCTKGLRATGVIGVSCHHDLWQVNGLGDLQLGEWFCNVDFVFLSSLRGISSKLKLVDSYDIGCEWHKHLWSQMLELPDDMHLSIPCEHVIFLVNKFHLAGHGKKCQAPFSFNFKKGVGQTNGEGPERLWAWLNGAGPSTKEMGPGGRRDTMNDFCGFMNWLKTVGLGEHHNLLVNVCYTNSIYRETSPSFAGGSNGQGHSTHCSLQRL
ncbi:hypothetical protein JAAARDRAFT_129342 [Jaapia argillacea MUCL 33604]|uniref:CxC2-like cysteine cluster KDZ transposase-associated domain-containing protein n=1 Tax=Jaapia argillacea MUCL 33604 TaxID=933084 RepID=A0A067Q3I7_9AGAM|nr:hypothetical protein JAAARDRAFT_129342 [Jaapia argillacea MUCL 33604]